MLNLNPDYRYFYVEVITDMRLVKVLEGLTNDYGDYEKLTPDRINEI